MRNRRLTVPIALLILGATATGFSWIDPVYKSVFEGNKRYEEGKFEEAHQEYAEAQAEAPESDEVRYNLGAAWYKQGNFEKAIEEFSQVAAGADTDLEAKALYNRGNALYQLGANDQQNAKEHWQRALDSYEDALMVDPDLEPARHNLELVQQQMKQLEQQQQQQQQQQQNNQQDPQGDEGEQEQDQPEEGEEEQQDQSQQDQEPEDRQQGQDQSNQENQQEGDPRNQQESGDEQQDQPEEADSGEEEQQQSQSSPGEDQQQPPQEDEQQPMAADPREMTPEEAERLLQALQESEEQGDRLPVRLPAQGPSTEYDW